MSLPFPPGPMGAGTILDHTFRIYRRNLGAMLLFALLIGGLSQLIVALMQTFLLSGSTAYNNLINATVGMFSGGYIASSDYGSLMRDMSGLLSSSAPSLFISLLVTLFVTPLVQGGITNTAAGYYHGVTQTAGGWFSQAGRSYGKLVHTGLAVFLCTLASVLVLILPTIIVSFLVSAILSVFLMSGSAVGVLISTLLLIVLFVGLVMTGLMWIMFIYPVAVCENAFGFKAVGRALSLCFRRFWKTLGVILLMYLIVYAVTLGVSYLFSVLSGLFLFPGWVVTVFDQLVSALFTPVLAIVPVLLYLDARIRREGYDLYLRSMSLQQNER